MLAATWIVPIIFLQPAIFGVSKKTFVAHDHESVSTA